jgi:hypothetical protein
LYAVALLVLWLRRREDFTGGHDPSTHETRRQPTSGIRRYIPHDAVKQDLARIAIVGGSGHPAMPKETFEASFERPIYVRVSGVVRVQELVRQDINIGVGQQRRIAARSRHVITLLGLSVRPDQGDADPIVRPTATPP